MTEAEFWDLTPREFSELQKRKADELHREDYRAAVVAWAVLAPWSKKKLTPGDILGEKETGPRALTAADRESSQRSFIAAMKAGTRGS